MYIEVLECVYRGVRISCTISQLIKNYELLKNKLSNLSKALTNTIKDHISHSSANSS